MSAETIEQDGRKLVRARNRERLLQAASALFAQRGYRGTTTRDIAEAAGITERTLFRHVSSKSELFREAVISPVEMFIEQFRSSWDQRPRGSRGTDVEIKEFIGNLLDVVEGERHLLLALLACLAYENDDEDFSDLRGTLAPLLSTLDDIFEVEAATRGWELDPVIGVRAIVGMVLALTIHSDWLFASRRTPSRERLVEELTRFAAWGVSGRPGPASA